MKNKIELDLKRVRDIKGNFFVPSYQRGYRWEKMDVMRLLEDIYKNGENKYCLQPIVVKKTNDERYELIDGQQRLTTLFIILKYMNHVSHGWIAKSIGFSLEYETRDSSAEFLEKIDLSRKGECIDFFYMCQAYETVANWFKSKEEDDGEDQNNVANNLYKYLCENVYIIWYEVPQAAVDDEKAKQESIDLFTRLNIGKIPLTSSELVKAMFLRGDQNENPDTPLRYERQLELALQWDNIERELHNDKLWYFLTNNDGKEYQTRIDLILDMVAENEESNREKYATFFFFDDLRNNPDKLKEKWATIHGDANLLGDRILRPLEVIWGLISQTFLIVKDWFENHELYHKVGYLIAASKNASKNTFKNASLNEIFKLSQSKTKSQFVQSIDNKIKESIALSNDKNYVDLTFEIANDYCKLKKLLLLFNVISVLKSGSETQWFPFDKLKSKKDGKPVWSLEHIHARESQGLVKEEEWKEWIRLHLPFIKAQQEKGTDRKELIERMEKAQEQVDQKAFKKIQEDALDALSEKGNKEFMHTISNLALLTTGDNAVLNNSTFQVKREEIIKLDKQGHFIPFCTRMAFFKYYTPSDKNQIYFWGKEDRNAYVDAINDILGDYLQTKIEH